MDSHNSSFKKENEIKLKLLVTLVVRIFLFATIIAIFVPIYPTFPSEGLDPSWNFGVNQATAQAFSFGKDIIFTYGPYASILTKLYHPATNLLVILGSFYLAISFFVYLVVLTKNINFFWIICICIIFTGLKSNQDIYLLAIPLLIGLLSFKIFSSGDKDVFSGQRSIFYVIFLFAPFGLLPLVKGSILILCSAITFLCSIFFILNNRKKLALTVILTPIISMLFFWMMAGQISVNLLNYLTNMTPIASGYTEAMAINGDSYEIFLFLVASFIIILAILFQKETTYTSKMFLFCIYFLFLFVTFKAAFVRHDAHATLAGIGILIAALSLLTIVDTKGTPYILCSAILCWAYIDIEHTKTSPARVVTNIQSTYLSMFQGFSNRIKYNNWPYTDFESAVKKMMEHAAIPIMEGTTDIYSYNQSMLIASGNQWFPRPIFQSYSAYTPELLKKNRDHLLGALAPNNIIFSIEPIDGRIASIEDGVSWPLLLKHYRPIEIRNTTLYLKRNNEPNNVSELKTSESLNKKFGEIIKIPNLNGPIFVQLEIKPTILGRIATLFFKPSQLEIILNLKTGEQKQFRIVSGMTKTGFVISPLIENLDEFLMLYGGNESPNPKSVESFFVDSKRSSFWQNEYSIKFSNIEKNTSADNFRFFNFNKLTNASLTDRVVIAEKCDGNIDTVNGQSSGAPNLFASQFVTVNGWLASSIEKGTLADEVYIVLSDATGNRKYIATNERLRPDVAASLKRPTLLKAGYGTVANVSGMKGKYTLGIAFKQENQIKICPQLQIPIMLNK
jgi:hypothetical protein